jgi:hypothetical protein
MNFTIKKEFDYYLYWVSERMNIFWRRYNNEPLKIEQSKYLFGNTQNKIWSEDKIFQDYKFTNVYRSLDRVSQYLIKNVIYTKNIYPKDEIVFRILFFKLFNKIETWELFKKEFGDIESNFIYERWSEIDNFIIKKLEEDFPLYSNAYVLSTAVKDEKYHHRKYLLTYKQCVFDNFDSFIDCNSLQGLFNKLLELSYVGNFLAMQFTIDLNYSDVFNFDENEFIVPGPGSLRGIDRCFEGQKKTQDYVEIIKWTRENLDSLLEEKGYNVRFLPNRKPTLIDIQNCYCEVSKYLRAVPNMNTGNSGEKRIKQKFKESNNKIEYKFPKKWGIDWK